MATVEQLSNESYGSKRSRPNPAVLKWARLLHLWLGTFFAPAIIFFAFSGALQTFSWHETTPGSSYKPPMWIQKMGQLHKKQTTVMRERKPERKPAHEAEGERPRNAQPEAPPSMPASTLLLKMFVFWMSVGLIATSILGIYMAFKFNRDRRLVWSLLIGGTVLPVLLVLL